MAPANLVDRHSEYVGDAPAFFRRWRPAGQENGFYPSSFEPGPVNKLVNVKHLLDTDLRYSLWHCVFLP